MQCCIRLHRGGLARALASLLAAVSLGACSLNGVIDAAPQPTAVLAGDSGPGVPVDSDAIAREALTVPGPGTLPATPVAARGPLDAQVRHTAPQSAADTDSPYMLDSGDKVRIFVYGQPNLSRIYLVDTSGFVSLPLIGAVKARGETTFDLERAVTVQLGAKYVKDPKVSVEVAAYRPFFILGEVRTAGQYPFVSGMTVQTAVAIAGGYSERANERDAIVTRRINGVTEKFRVPPEMAVLPGDTIYVRERFF